MDTWQRFLIFCLSFAWILCSFHFEETHCHDLHLAAWKLSWQSTGWKYREGLSWKVFAFGKPEFSHKRFGPIYACSWTRFKYFWQWGMMDMQSKQAFMLDLLESIPRTKKAEYMSHLFKTVRKGTFAERYFCKPSKSKLLFIEPFGCLLLTCFGAINSTSIKNFIGD